MSEARLEARDEGGYALTGRVTVDTVPVLLEESRDLFAAGEATSIDCAGIEQADSAAVALMLEWMRQAAAAEAEVVFAGLPERMRSIVAVSDLEDVIPVAD